MDETITNAIMEYLHYKDFKGTLEAMEQEIDKRVEGPTPTEEKMTTPQAAVVVSNRESISVVRLSSVTGFCYYLSFFIAPFCALSFILRSMASLSTVHFRCVLVIVPLLTIR